MSSLNNSSHDIIDDFSKADSLGSAVIKIKTGLELANYRELDNSIRYSALKSIKILAVQYNLGDYVRQINKMLKD